MLFWELLWRVQYLINRRPGVGSMSHVNVGVIVGSAAFNQ